MKKHSIDDMLNNPDDHFKNINDDEYENEIPPELEEFV